MLRRKAKKFHRDYILIPIVLEWKRESKVNTIAGVVSGGYLYKLCIYMYIHR
jgi:hypothetical protein